MNMNNIMAISFAFLIIVISGCAPLKVKHTTGDLNLHYQPNKSAENKSNETLVMLEPQIDLHIGESVSKQVRNDLYFRYLTNTRYDVFSVNDKFKDNYAQPLVTNIQSALSDIYSKKGFKEISISNMDELTYSQKQSAYLATKTKIRLDLFPKVKQSSCNSSQSYCTLKGDITISGKMIVNYIEPLTKEIVYNQIINLSDFKISIPFTEQFLYDDNNKGIIDLATKIASSASDKKIQLVDNIDKSLTDALNLFYSKSMAKADAMISQKQILSYKDVVTGLKNRKVF